MPKEYDYTYLLTDGLKYKIGGTDDFKDRLSGHRSSNPDIQVLFNVPKEVVKENTLHKMFKAYCYKPPIDKKYGANGAREWYEFDTEVLEIVYRIFQQGLLPEEKELERKGDFKELRQHLQFYLGSRLAPREYTDRVCDEWATYKFTFPPYKGRALISMTSEKELDYCFQLATQGDLLFDKVIKKKYDRWKNIKNDTNYPIKAVLACKWWITLKIRENMIYTEFIERRQKEMVSNFGETSKIFNLFGFSSCKAEAKISHVQHTSYPSYNLQGEFF